MWRFAYILFGCVVPLFARPQNVNDFPQTTTTTTTPKPKEARITKLLINTDIQMRYAITKVEAVVKNKNDFESEVFFDIFIPKSAFVSNFSMIVKGQEYVAKVETKEKAKETYENSDDISGLVQNQAISDFKDTEHITFSAKVDAYDKATFFVTYEDQLKRVDGLYNHKLNLHLKNQIIDDFKIKINITESLPLKVETIEAIRETNEIDQDIDDVKIEFDPKINQAIIEYVPSIEDQKEGGQEWQFNLNYDVERSEDGNEVQIGAGKFVHYYSPDNLPTLTKHIIFVLDVSGSMSGRKIQQTKDAMLMIFENLNEEDSFDIVTFNSQPNIYEWAATQNNSNCQSDDQIRLTKDCLIDEAREFIFGLNAGGGTNINDAMLSGVEMAKNISNSEKFSDVKQTMIIFMTDGQGTMAGYQVKDNIREANTGKIPIFGLALGNDADFDLIKDISDESGAFAQRIYESGRAYEQLEQFYNEISDPKLQNVEFQYLANGRLIPLNLLTKTKIENAFGKEEYVIVGEFENTNGIDGENDDSIIENFEIKITGLDANGQYSHSEILKPCIDHPIDEELGAPTFPYYPHRCIPPIPSPKIPENWKKSEAEKFTERLWAFKRINYLLENKDEECENNALDDTQQELEKVSEDCDDKKVVELAKKYNFVTKVTSLVVESNDEYVQKNSVVYKENTPKVYGDALSRPGGFGSSLSLFSTKSVGYSSYAAAAPCPTCLVGGLAISAGPRLKNRKRPQARPNSSQFIVKSVQSTSSPIYDYDDIFDDLFDSQPILSQTTTTAAPCTIGKLTLYSQTYFRGETVEIQNDSENLDDFNFDDKIGSVNIEGNCCWRIYVDGNYSGSFLELKPAEYQSAIDIQTIFKKASSAKMYTC